jgi:Zn-dependent protease with chaperone function
VSAPAIGPDRPRLNPLAFPQDTTLRFVLLILSVLGASLFAFDSIHRAVVDPAPAMLASLRCAQPIGADGDHRQCVQLLTRGTATWMLGGLGILTTVAIVIYFLMPPWKLRRRELQPLTADDAPEVVAHLARLSDEAGLRVAPKFVWNPLSPAASGLAFGHPGRRYVALGGGLATRFYTDPDEFRAVVLHELGHLRNRDIDKTYFTMALWYSFVLVAVAPLLASLYDEGVSYISFVLWRLLALVALVYLSRNAILRSRELYADARASQSRGAADGLRRVIGALPAPARRRWRRLFSVHPDPTARVAALDDPDRLFRPGAWQAVAAGIVLTLVYLELVTLIGGFHSDPVETTWLAALAAAPPAAGVVVLGIWRGAFRSLARSAATGGVWRLGVALGAGFLLGEGLSFHQHGGEQSGTAAALAQVLGRREIRPIVGSAIGGAGVVWVVLPIVSFVLLALWLDGAAAIWLSRGGERLPRVSLVAAILAAGSVLTVWTGTYFLLHDSGILSAANPPLDRLYGEVGAAMWNGPRLVFRFFMDALSLVVGRWELLSTFALLWAFPLSAAAIRGRSVWPSRAFLGTGRPPSPQPERLNVSRAILVGATAGLAASAGVLALQAGIHASAGVGPPVPSVFFLGFYYWDYVIAAAAQMLAAAAAVALCPRRPVLHGLLAGFLAGALSTAGVLAGTTIGSCLAPLDLESAHCPRFDDGDFARLTVDQVLAHGSVLVLASSLAALAFVRIVQHFRRADVVAPAQVPG